MRCVEYGGVWIEYILHIANIVSVHTAKRCFSILFIRFFEVLFICFVLI